MKFLPFEGGEGDDQSHGQLVSWTAKMLWRLPAIEAGQSAVSAAEAFQDMIGF